MNAQRLFGIFLVAVCILSISGVTAQQQIPMPHVFYGTVYVIDQVAPEGVMVEARGTGVQDNIAGNPVYTSQDGTYGGPGTFDQKLIVQGEVEAGTPIEFYVNGVRAQCQDIQKSSSWLDTHPYTSSEMTQLNLRVEELAPLPVAITPTSSPTKVTPTLSATPTEVSTPIATTPGTPSNTISQPAAATTTRTVTILESPAQTPRESVTPLSTVIPVSAPERGYGFLTFEQFIIFTAIVIVMSSVISVLVMRKLNRRKRE